MGTGVWNKLLRVDLSAGTVAEEPIADALFRKYVGGAGIGALILKNEVPVNVAPLDPENRLIFATGPFQASRIPGSAKFSVISRSPLTGIFADSAAGGRWGITFKKCGYDVLIVQGRAQRPCYIRITEGQASIEDAGDLWGLDSFETARRFKERHPDCSAAAIGPAGECCVGMANIVVDAFSFAGRCGLGAVMGSKNLKAVVVDGHREVPVHDQQSLTSLERGYRKSVAQAAMALRVDGTVGGLTPGAMTGNLPVKNWQEVGWDDQAKRIGHPGYARTLKPRPKACVNCPVACHRHVAVTFDDGYEYEGPGPEYESLAMLGSNCCIDDLELLVKATDFCNRMGLDTISAGSCASFAMEALEKGHTRGHKPGYSLTWGNGDALMRFLGELATGSGFGGVFSGGVARACESMEPAARDYACHVKGLEVPGHDPRVYYNLALSYATGNRGACHMRAYSQISTMGALLPEAGIDTSPAPNTLEGAGRVVKAYQDFTALCNASVICQFMIWGGFGLSSMVEVMNAITGWEMDVGQAMECGHRIFTVQRIINNGYGISGKDDHLPIRFFQPSAVEPRRGQAPEPFTPSLMELYRQRGWDSSGYPTAETIADLGV